LVTQITDTLAALVERIGFTLDHSLQHVQTIFDSWIQYELYCNGKERV